MRDAITPLVRGQRRLAAVAGHVSRRSELLALAGRLEAAPDEEAGWAIWCTATGLFSARHRLSAEDSSSLVRASVVRWATGHGRPRHPAASQVSSPDDAAAVAEFLEPKMAALLADEVAGSAGRSQ
jgi:hypothetical protein